MTSPFLDRPPRTLAEAERDRELAIARRRLRLIRVDEAPIDPARPIVQSIPSAASSPGRSRRAEPRAVIIGPLAAPGFFARLRRKLRRITR